MTISICFLSCKETKTEESAAPIVAESASCSPFSAAQLKNFNWVNDPKVFSIASEGLLVEAEEGTDYFNNPEDGSVTGTAPLLYQNLSGDFIATAVVKPDFNAQWNAVSLMAHIDETNWIKFAFESSDATGPSVVTVVTKGVSDDANGVVIENTDTLWLSLVKKDSIYAMHWSANGKDFKMARLTTMPATDSLKVGVEFQSPVGEKALHLLKCYQVEFKTVENLRDINQ